MSDEMTLDLLEAKIQELRELDKQDLLNLSSEIERLEKRLEEMRTELYANMSDWERVKLARHPHIRANALHRWSTQQSCATPFPHRRSRSSRSPRSEYRHNRPGGWRVFLPVYPS